MRVTNNRGIQILGTLAFSLILSCQLSFAQSGVKEQGWVLEEIVITATKRSENLQDVAISITALSGEKLERLGIKDVSELENFVPNLDFGNTHTNDNPAIRIRGISSSASNIGFEAGVGLYIDGVYMGRNASLLQSLTDISMVEFLRGPQGTLFGKNTTAGALNIRTNRPSEEFEGGLQLELGNYNLVRSRARISGPLVEDKLYGKVSVFTDDRDGFEKNIVPGASDALDEHQRGTRGELRFTPAQQLDMSLRWDWSESDRKAFAWGVHEDDPSEAGHEPHVIAQDDTDEDRTINGVSFTVDYALDNDFNLTSISAYRGLEIKMAGDLDSMAADVLTLDKREEFKQYSQEIRLVSPKEDRLSYVAGLYYYKQDADSLNNQTATIAAPLIGLDINHAGFLLGGGDPALLPFVPTAGFSAWDSLADLTTSVDSTVETESMALYLDGSFDITDRLSLLFGIRYTKEDKELKMSQKGVNIFFPSFEELEDDRNDSNWLPSLGLRFFLNDDVTLYGKVSRGFKSGGWNSTRLTQDVVYAGPLPVPEVTATPAEIDAIRFDTETITNYEVGFKSELIDGRLRLNAAAFYLDYEDMQRSVFAGLLGNVTTNAGKARSQGFEIEVDALPFENINISASIGYADAIFKSFDPDTSTPGDLDGLRLSGPKWNSSVALTYSKNLMDIGKFYAGMDYSYKSKSYGNYSNPEGTSFGVTELLNAKFGLVMKDWEVALWAKNVLDKNYVIARQFDSDFVFFQQDSINYGAPRTYGVNISYNF